jgi:hypothetical protein
MVASEMAQDLTAYHDLALKLNAPQANIAPPELKTCLHTLNNAVSAGFDDVARLREDPRLELLRNSHKTDFERLVATASAAGKAALPAETKP